MIYCNKCTYPIIAVNLTLDDSGLCSGCIVSDEKIALNWEKREEEFRNLMLSYNKNKTGEYDCIIPVSGGKDSHFQAWYIKEMGLNPLLVTYYTHNYTATGEENLKNIGNSIGVDHLIFTPSKKTIAKMNRVGFEMTGDMSWHFHCGAWTVPFQIAVEKEIPILLYGEHGFLDLAGQYSMDDKPEYTKRARLEDTLRGYTWRDFVGKNELTEQELSWCKYPSDDKIRKIGIRGLFMGNYIYWDANKHLKIAEQLGFKRNPEPFERTYRDFSNVDDIHENGIKDYLKWIKFGYGRCTDHTSKDIRLGYISRDQGVELVKKYDHIKAKKSLRYFLDFVEMKESEFDKIADNFRDNRVWWIKDGKWWKDNVWGEPSSFGKVHLAKEKWKNYEKK